MLFLQEWTDSQMDLRHMGKTEKAQKKSDTITERCKESDEPGTNRTHCPEQMQVSFVEMRNLQSSSLILLYFRGCWVMSQR